MRIAIIGYGIAGIAAAIQLRRLGHNIEHFERSTETSHGGAGLLLHPSALRLLDELGVRDAAEQRGARIERIHAETVQGRSIMDFRYADGGTGLYGIGIQRRALIELLRDADTACHDLRLGHHIVGVDTDRATLRNRDGSNHGPYDLVVAADGTNSPIRRAVPSIVRRDRDYQWTALVCLVQDRDSVRSDMVRQRFDGTQHVSCWPVGSSAGSNADSNASSQTRQTSIAIGISNKQAASGQMLGTWKPHIARLYPPLASLLERASDDTPMMAYRYRDVVLRRYTVGRLVLLGDAAHSMSPQLGQGASLALEDAIALARALSRYESPNSALAAFDVDRRARIKRYQLLSRAMTPVFQSDSRVLATLRDRFFAPMMRLQPIQHRARALLCD